MEFSLGITETFRFASKNRLEIQKQWNGLPIPLNDMYDIFETGNETGKKLITGIQLDFRKYFSINSALKLFFALQINQSITADYKLFSNSIYRTALSPKIGIRQKFYFREDFK